MLLITVCTRKGLWYDPCMIWYDIMCSSVNYVSMLKVEYADGSVSYISMLCITVMQMDS